MIVRVAKVRGVSELNCGDPGFPEGDVVAAGEVPHRGDKAYDAADQRQIGWVRHGKDGIITRSRLKLLAQCLDGGSGGSVVE